MSLAEKPTHGGRPRLSLPGYRHAPPPELPRAVPAASEALHAAGEALSPPQPYDPRRLSAPYHTRMLGELAGILGDAPPPVFAARIPMPLRIGVHVDLVVRFPNSDPVALGRWLSRWTGTTQYLQVLISGGPRFNADGNVAGDVSAHAVEHARRRAAGLRGHR
jgi:hypothetical protein